MNTIVIEHFNIILFHKAGPANMQQTNQSNYNVYNKSSTGYQHGQLLKVFLKNKKKSFTNLKNT